MPDARLTADERDENVESHDRVWLTVREGAAHLRCSPKLLYREINAGRCRAARIGGRREIRLRRAWLDEFLVATSEPR